MFTNQRGVTLIELIIVMILVVIIFSIASVNFFQTQQRGIFNNAVTESINLIKKSRNYAISSRSITYNPPGGIQKKVPPGGYGVNINNTGTKATLTLFADIWNDDKSAFVNIEEYEEIDGVFQKVYPDRIFQDEVDQDHALDRYNFPDRIEIESIELITGAGASVNPSPEVINIIYEPPLGEAIITDSTGNTDFKEVYIHFYNDYDVQVDKEKTVYLHKISGFPTTDFDL